MAFPFIQEAIVYKMVTKRAFDIILSSLLILALFPIFIFIAICIKTTSKGPILFWQRRVGKNNVAFCMPKFRTMLIETPNVATDLLQDSEKYITGIGKTLRSYSLDELPQLISIFKGEMSFVGPRPALYNQFDLIELRENNGINKVRPGVTGWAQVNGRDQLSIKQKVNFEIEYQERANFLLDMYILWLTIFKTIRREGISH